MKPEELDWAVYHIITRRKWCTLDDICEDSGFSQEGVRESLDRLQTLLLVIRRDRDYRACSIDEYIISSQMKHDPASSIIIENGIIKVKKTSGSPSTERFHPKGAGD